MVCSFFPRIYRTIITLLNRKARICKHQFKLTEHECKLVFGRVLYRSNDQILSHVILVDVNKYSLKCRL